MGWIVHSPGELEAVGDRAARILSGQSLHLKDLAKKLRVATGRAYYATVDDDRFDYEPAAQTLSDWPSVRVRLASMEPKD